MPLIQYSGPARRWAVILPVAVVLAVIGLIDAPAQAYDYLEHSYFADRACLEAQVQLGAQIQSGLASRETAVRYLALGLVCPERWEKRYCVDGYKQAEAGLNRLDEPPAQGRGFAATFGDFAALPDHLSKYGPIRGLPRLGTFGLTFDAWRWLTGRNAGAGGVIENVARDGCAADDGVPWRRVEADIQATLARFARTGPESVPGSLLTPLTHAPVPKGPADPAGIYSFKNPHYLDLVLRNHHHFGKQAFSAWLGFHSAAVSVARYRCEKIIDFTPGQLSALAADMPGFSDVNWSSLDAFHRHKKGCELMRQAVHRRLLEWAERADPARVAPVQSLLGLLRTDAPGAQRLAPERDALLDEVAVATTALILEGLSLHFLHDGLAAGHMRTIRAKDQLGVVRYDHDSDNQNGVVALLQTRSGEYPFFAFGDTYLLGAAMLPEFVDCDWQALAHGMPAPRLVSNCHIQHQRGLLVATASSSIIDWALGGAFYEAPHVARQQQPEACAGPDALITHICRMLPATATLSPGLEDNLSGKVVARMHHGTIPVPPPPFAYQSLMIDFGMEATQQATQIGLRLNLLEELGSRANWMTSHSLGVRTTFGDSEFNQMALDYAYSFHWRWAARFTVDARNSAFTGFRDFDARRAFFMGIAPGAGITVLPEGWTKLPVEVSLGYRLPLVFFSSDQGFFGGNILGGHWIILGLGLAYM